MRVFFLGVQAGCPDDMRLQISQDGTDGWMIRCTPGSNHKSNSHVSSPHDPRDVLAVKGAGPTLEQCTPSADAEAQSMVVRVGVEYPRTPPQAEFPATVSLRVSARPACTSHTYIFASYIYLRLVYHVSVWCGSCWAEEPAHAASGRFPL